MLPLLGLRRLSILGHVFGEGFLKGQVRKPTFVRAAEAVPQGPKPKFASGGRNFGDMLEPSARRGHFRCPPLNP